MPALRTFADWAARLTFDDLPPESIIAAKLRLLDYLGTAFHASTAKPWRALLRVPSITGSPAEATVIGTTLRLGCPWAAMFNSYPHMSEGSRFAGGHCAWNVMPVALAVAERQADRAPVSGRDLILAIVIAYELLLRAGRAIYPGVHERGFQPTTVRGPMGGAAAAGKLLGLDAEKMTHALAVAATEAGGLEAAITPWPVYCYQMGRASEAGVMAALAAEGGLRGSEDILETGFLPVFGGRGGAEAVMEGLGAPRAITTTYLKLHYGCRHAHTPVDASLDLMRGHGLTAGDIEAVSIRTYPMALAICGGAGAAGKLESHFDMKTMVSIALVYGDATSRRFHPASVANPAVRETARRITLLADPALESEFPAKWPAFVEMITRDGRRLVRRRDLPRGEPEDPLSAGEIEAKFYDLAGDTPGRANRVELAALAQNLEKSESLADLFRLLRPPADGNDATARP